MITTIIVIAVVLAAIAAMFILREKNESKPATNEPVVENHPENDWELVSLPTSEGCSVNGHTCTIRKIALLNKKEPHYGCKFDIAFNFKYFGGTQAHASEGEIMSGEYFMIQGQKYYGQVLAGGPEAEIISISKFKIQ
jgi:hypothetical protein